MDDNKYQGEYKPKTTMNEMIKEQIKYTQAQARKNNRATTLPTDAFSRKKLPIGTGVLDYFPDALVSVAEVSYVGNQQHNPGQPLHWDRSKSQDEADTLIRHFLERGKRDTDGLRHSAKMTWRALALLQKEIEEDEDAFKQQVGQDSGH